MTHELTQPTTSLSLSNTERDQLADYEARIARGLETFLDVGEALAGVRDSKLYREEFASFEAYCERRWQLGRRRAYQLMDAAAVAGEMGKIFHMRPQRESHAAALAKIEPQHREAVWERVLAETDTPTAALIDRVHSTYLAELLGAAEATLATHVKTFTQVLAALRMKYGGDGAALHAVVHSHFPDADAEFVQTIIRVFGNEEVGTV
ncbi:MAG: hypothetical protein HC911_18135 [Chloroflexaceae bacterium]|nr:hypothetical protein [Chloroflexaceae bacterium]